MKALLIALSLFFTIGAAAPDVRPFDEEADAMAAVDAALERAAAREARVLIVMGANWCHDSRGLAESFEEPAFADFIAENYELVFVEAGFPRRDEANNMAVAERFHVAKLEGTPNLIVVDAEGTRWNPLTDVHSWNNADSREADAVMAWLERYATLGR